MTRNIKIVLFAITMSSTSACVNELASDDNGDALDDSDSSTSANALEASPQDIETAPSEAEANAVVVNQKQIRNFKSKLCMGVSGASTSSGARIQQFPCDGRSNQKWRPFGEFGLQNVNSNLCVGVNNGSTSPGSEIRQFKCDRLPNQTWFTDEFIPGTLSIRSAAFNCIGVDHASTTAGAQMKLFPCDATPNQQWIFE